MIVFGPVAGAGGLESIVLSTLPRTPGTDHKAQPQHGQGHFKRRAPTTFLFFLLFSYPLLLLNPQAQIISTSGLALTDIRFESSLNFPKF